MGRGRWVSMQPAGAYENRNDRGDIHLPSDTQGGAGLLLSRFTLPVVLNIGGPAMQLGARRTSQMHQKPGHSTPQTATISHPCFRVFIFNRLTKNAPAMIRVVRMRLAPPPQ